MSLVFDFLFLWQISALVHGLPQEMPQHQLAEP
jgi:hypothetical protein